MGFVRTFEDFRPPKRFDFVPFTSVQIQEASTVAGPFTTIDTLTLIPTDADPEHPASRDLTTANAQLDPGWYVLVWTDGLSNFFPSGPISSLRSLEPFISREELGEYIDRDLSDKDIAFTIIEGACDTCRTFTEQRLGYVAGDAITLDGTGTDALLLPERPVTEITSVEVNGTAVTDYLLNAQGILFRKAGDAAEYSWIWPIWPIGRQNVSVTYSHGYVNVPGDLRQVALSLSKRVFEQASTGAISSETLGSYSVTYNTGGSAGIQAFDLTKTERAILRKYKQAKSF